MRTLISLAFFALSLGTSLLTYQIVGTPMSAMITGSTVYACLEMITITMKV